MCITLILYFCLSKKRLRKADQFRLHNDLEPKQSKQASRIREMFKNESQRPGNSNGSSENEYSDVGTG